MSQFKWRGTWGFGDAMMALNVAHNYSYTHDTPVKLEMHWPHDEDYKTDKRDTQTIVQQMEFIHKQYHQNDRVELTHVFKTTLFDYSVPYVKDYRTDKDRWFLNDKDIDIKPYKDWIFKDIPKPKKSFMIEDNLKGVYWTPIHNSETPKSWKMVLTKEDWEISKVRFETVAELKELSYRTPVQKVFKIIKECDFIFCYEGMWHFIARNFAKPIVIPSSHSLTTKRNTPQAKILTSRKSYLDWLLYNDMKVNITGIQNRARVYYKELIKYYED
jgi:hypothetical protein